MKIKELKLLNTFKSFDTKQTIDFAYKFSKKLNGGDMILLVGDYGVGKTTFLNGILKYLGSKERVISSSFIKISFYHAKKLNLVHCDFYRTCGDDIAEIIEYINDENIIAIEWPPNIENFLRFHPYVIKINIINEEQRLIEVYKYV